MKKTVKIKIGGKEKEIGFSIRQLARLEEDINCSIMGVFRGGAVRNTNIKFTAAALHNGLSDEIGEDEAYDLIEKYCEESTLDDLNAKIIAAIFATGLFTPGKNEKKAADETGKGQ